MSEKKAVDVAKGIIDLMEILKDAKMKDVTPKIARATAVKKVVSAGPVGGEMVAKAIKELEIKTYPAYERMVHAEDEAKEVVKETVHTYEHGSEIATNGKSKFTGSKKKGKTGAKGSKVDAARESIKDIYTAAIVANGAFGPGAFVHSTEGLVVRLGEADYAIKITKSKEFKIDATEEGFVAEKDFSTRGKAQNSASAIAKALYNEFENQISNLEMGFVIVSAKASGIMLQGAAGEYTVKISKKRDRVGFEAEKGAAYEK